MPSLIRLLTDALETHASYSAKPSPPVVTPKTLDDYPVWAAKMAKKKKPQDCYHCHFVFDVERRQKIADGTWSRDQIWRFPPPERIGLELDRDRQELLVDVSKKTPARKAGLKKGDRLLTLQGQRILTHADVSWVLEQASPRKTELDVSYQRGSKTRTGTIKLATGWKHGTPLEFSWRPSKWQLTPRPGFGGRELSAQQKRALGLDPKAFAFKVSYIVTWNDEPRYGKNAQRAGIRKGDVVTQIGSARLTSGNHFHAWYRLTRTPGEVIPIRILRGGKPKTLRLTVVE
jgi:membrane-associated protease RseP (regulator of RpoE activity)